MKKYEWEWKSINENEKVFMRINKYRREWKSMKEIHIIKNTLLDT